METSDDFLKPYKVDCKKHGSGWYALDECPRCMEESYHAEMDRIPASICWGCAYCQEEPGMTCDCGWYGFPQKPRKKKCKHYKAEDFRDYTPEW